MDVLKLFESLNNIELNESKADQEMFINKYGQDLFDRYNKIKNKIHGEWTSSETGQFLSNPKDIIQLVKQGYPELIDELITYYETEGSKSDKRKRAKEGAKLVFENKETGEKIYYITTPEAMQLYGENTTWCLAGRYKGHEEEQLKWWNYYLPRTDGGYYVLILPNGEKYCILYDSKTDKLDSVWNAVDSFGGNSNVVRSFKSTDFPGSVEVRKFFNVTPSYFKDDKEYVMSECKQYIENNPLVATIPFIEFRPLSAEDDDIRKFLSTLKIILLGDNTYMIYDRITKHFANVQTQLIKACRGSLDLEPIRFIKKQDNETLQKLLAVYLHNQFIIAQLSININDMLPDRVEVDMDKAQLKLSCSAEEFCSYIEDETNELIDYIEDGEVEGEEGITFRRVVEFAANYNDSYAILFNISNDEQAIIASIAVRNQLYTSILKSVYKFIINRITKYPLSIETELRYMQNRPGWLEDQLRNDYDKMNIDIDD